MSAINGMPEGPAERRNYMRINKRYSKFTALVLFLSLLMTMLFGQVLAVRAETDPVKAAQGLYRMESIMGISAETYAIASGITVEEAKNYLMMELKEGGACTFTADKDVENMYWRLEGANFVLSEQPNGAALITGTIQDGLATMDIEGMELKLRKDTPAAPEAQTTTATQGQEEAIPEDISGVYRLNSIMGMDMQTYATLMGTTLENAANTWVMDMKPDGTAYMAVDGQISAIKWVREGDKITLIAVDNGVEDKLEGKLSGDRILLNVEEVEVALKRDAVQ